MPKTIRALILYVVALGSPNALGFEIFTHALITFNAYSQARLGADFTLLSNLGLLNPGATSAYQHNPLGRTYLDVSLAQALPRTPQPIETLAFPKVEDNPTGSGNGFNFTRDQLKVSGWLMSGAIREDDNPHEGAFDDPYVPTKQHSFHREFNHFFDPSKNRPLTIIGASGGRVALGEYYARDTGGDSTIHRAPDWATGTDDAFAPLLARGADRLNHFTTLDAREAMWRALTLKSIDSAGGMHDLLLSTIPGNSSMQTLRNAYWATTFRALGDILHLNQDMAQPQHTRNEAHSGAGTGWPVVAPLFDWFVIAVATGHESIFEKYIDARARGLSFNFPGTGVVAPAPLSFADYPIPRFTRYSDYWSTGVPAGSPPNQPLTGFVNGKGLADYSNRGFYTVANNYDSHEYDYPSPPLGGYTPELPTFTFPGTSGLIRTQYLKGTVTDSLGNPGSEIRMTVHGIFDDVTNEYGITSASRYTLDANVFDDQASLLIPRAVAYSAGLLDYFFRGELQIALPDDGVYAVVDHTQNQCANSCGFSTIKLKLKNTTPNNEAMSSGLFVAVVKYHRNLCYQPDLSGDPGGPQFNQASCRSPEEEIVVSDPSSFTSLPSGTVQQMRFTFPLRIPINATDIYLQVVFRGQLGNETDAVVVTTKNISEPNYVAFVNDFDYHYNATLDTFQSVAPDPLTQTITQINVKLGNATTPVATLVNLGARKYAQLAFLTDLGATGTEKLVVDYSAPGIGSPLTYDLPISTFDSPGGTVYQRLPRVVSSYRGMWSDYRLDFFQGGGYYSIAMCSAQDTRRICTSAGLTPISSADAVAWTINFP